MKLAEVLKDLTPKTAEALVRATNDLEILGVRYAITEGRRTLLTQCLYALQGRLGNGNNAIPQTSLETACRQAGIRPPGAGIITWTLQSNHLDGNAVDIMPLLPNGNINWNQQDQRIVDVMKKHGFRWGGEFKTVDPPHFEIAA